MINQDFKEGEEQEGLIIRRHGKIVFAIAYENPYPAIRYLLARDRQDALRQLLRSRRSLGKIVGMAPAIGVMSRMPERQRIYCFGSNL